MATQVSAVQNVIHSAVQDVTPVRLRLLLVGICLSSFLFCLIATITVGQHEHALKTVGNDAVPSVIAAHQIKMGVETMDADLADELLYPAAQPDSQYMANDFEMARLVVCKELVAAAKNITYPSEQEPIENIQIALGQFEAQAQAARDSHRAGKNSDALLQYRTALQTLEDKLLPSADALNKSNVDVLEETYAHEKGLSAMARGLVMVLGLLLIGLLVYTQIYLNIRFHRRVNMPLLIVTVGLAILLQHLTAALGSSSLHLKVAKEDAYDSILALLDARSDSYESNAAESRWLLDPARAAIYRKQFADTVAQVARFDPGSNFSKTIALAESQLANNEKLNLPSFKGSLADELNNVRFPGEGEAALEALEAFNNYCSIDQKTEQLERSGDHAGALKLALGFDPNGSNFHFSRYDDALGRALKINEEVLQMSVKRAGKSLDDQVIICFLLSIFIAVCADIGLRPRIEEYQKSTYLHKGSH